MNIGITIKKCRCIRNMGQSQLAKLCGISESYISLIEKNKRRVTLNILEKISEALAIPISVIIFLTSDREAIKEMDSELYNKFLSCIGELLNGK